MPSVRARVWCGLLTGDHQVWVVHWQWGCWETSLCMVSGVILSFQYQHWLLPLGDLDGSSLEAKTGDLQWLLCSSVCQCQCKHSDSVGEFCQCILLISENHILQSPCVWFAGQITCSVKFAATYWYYYICFPDLFYSFPLYQTWIGIYSLVRCLFLWIES